MKILPHIFCEQPVAIFSNNAFIPANPKKQSKKIPILFVILLIALCSYTETFAQYSAADDEYVVDGSVLMYVAQNDVPPGNWIYVETLPSHGHLNNLGNMTLSYWASYPYTGSDSFTYKYCWSQNGQSVCTNTATVTLDVIGNNDSQNFGSSCWNPKTQQLVPVPPDNVGQPVNVTNGNMWLQQTDYSLPGLGEAIEVNRFYNSSDQTSGLFGFGWSSKYDESLMIYDDRMIRLDLPDAKGIFFGRPNTGSPFTSISAEFTGQITKEQDNTYTLTFHDGRVHKFGTTGMLLWQRDRNGNQTTLSYDVNNQLTGITDPAGRSITLIPNTDGTISQISDSVGTIADYEYFPGTTLLKSVTYPDGSKYKFEYHTVGTKTLLATVKDALDNILETHAFDTLGRATTSEKHGGIEKYTIQYTNSELTTVTDALGRVTKYHFMRKWGKNVITQVEGSCNCGGSGPETTTYQYNEKLDLVKTIDALLNQTTYAYDGSRNVIKISNVLGIDNFTYNSFGQILTHTDKMGGVTTNTYSAEGELLTTTDALNKTTTFAYTSNGLPETITDARNHTTTFTYDAEGRLTVVEDANNKTRNFGYDARARLTSTTNALNHTTVFEYDLNNRLKKVTYPDTNFITYTYDLAGRRTGVTDARNNTTTFGYDNAYRLTSVTDALNHTSSIGYDLMSNVISRTDALGNTTNYEYDSFNRLKKVIHPPAVSGGARLEESFEYDKLGNVKKRIDTANRETLYDYDTASRLIKTTDALLQITQFEYNARSQMTKVTDALNQEYTFTYDPLGRELTRTRAGTTMSYEYDAVGNKTKRTDDTGRITTFAYDNLNRLIASASRTFVYDDVSRLSTATNGMGTVSFTYDSRNRVKTTTDVFGNTLEYDYDPNGNRSQLKLNGNVHSTYVYDAVNRLTELTDEAGQTFAFGYDIANRLISRAVQNGVSSTYEHDGMGRLTRLKHQSPTAVLADNQYAYNPAGQISQIAELNQTKVYTYDGVDRLTGMASSIPSAESYAYDAVGNRTSSHRSASYAYQPLNRVVSTQTATFAHFANGNRSGRSANFKGEFYSWDYEDRLTRIGSRTLKADYMYDALGRRVKRSSPTSSFPDTKFVYDGFDVVIDDDAYAGITTYQNGPGIDNKLKLETAGISKYFLQDHLGSTTALADSSGTVTEQTGYDSFGNATNEAFSTRYQFTGREFDPHTKLYYHRARWYDADIGRFISEDPIGFGGGDINLYGYVRNNTTNRTDPLGLFDPVTWAGAAATAAASESTAAGAAGGAAFGGAAFGTAFGGLAAGYAIGYYPGQWSAQQPWNPLVYGPFNPFGTPYNPYASPQPMPQAARRPTCEPTASSRPFYRNPPLSVPFSSPDDDGDWEDTCSRLAALCLRKPWLPPGSPFGRRKPCGDCVRACRANKGVWDFDKCPIEY